MKEEHLSALIVIGTIILIISIFGGIVFIGYVSFYKCDDPIAYQMKEFCVDQGFTNVSVKLFSRSFECWTTKGNFREWKEWNYGKECGNFWEEYEPKFWIRRPA